LPEEGSVFLVDDIEFRVTKVLEEKDKNNFIAHARLETNDCSISIKFESSKPFLRDEDLNG
jgi:hypothetical protein